jgi:regulator of protease activity HflC (stomatin/prohibitin superfamily)
MLSVRAIVIMVGIFFVLAFGSCCFKAVPAGQVSVAALFGKVQDKTFTEGLHFPVNPLYSWTTFDVRNKTLKEEDVEVPSQDQLTSKVDINVQYRLVGSMAPAVLRETGNPEAVVEVHLVPKLRSILREQGKTVRKAEDFFTESVQQKLQADLKIGLAEYVQSKGIEIQDVLIRDIDLPEFIIQAIEQKKVREQEAEKQKAELDRFTTQQQEKVVEAEARNKAALMEAEQRRTLADAQSYEIHKINEAIATNPAYIQIKALETLQAISKDPASKLYFIDSKSNAPLPLMHLGDVVRPVN